jgi:hypothetical protein
MKYFFSIMSMYTNFQCVQIINISERGEGRGSRDQEDRGLKSAQGNSLRDPILKILNTKKGWWSGSNGRVPALQV